MVSIQVKLANPVYHPYLKEIDLLHNLWNLTADRWIHTLTPCFKLQCLDVSGMCTSSVYLQVSTWVLSEPLWLGTILNFWLLPLTWHIIFSLHLRSAHIAVQPCIYYVILMQLPILCRTNSDDNVRSSFGRCKLIFSVKLIQWERQSRCVMRK
jgi:hypothetical protein